AWTDLGGASTRTPVVARNRDGRLELFIVDASGHLAHRWQGAPNGSWDAWQVLGTTVVSQPPAVVLDKHGLLELIGVDAHNGAYYQMQTRAAEGGANEVVDTWSDPVALNGTVTAAPAAALNWDGC